MRAWVTPGFVKKWNDLLEHENDWLQVFLKFSRYCMEKEAELNGIRMNKGGNGGKNEQG